MIRLFPSIFAILLVLVASGCIGQEPDTGIEGLRLPEGFSIGVYAEVNGARSLALGDNGTLFVGTRGAGRVYAIPDEDGDGRADGVITLAEGLDTPNGVAFYGGDLYVAETSRILRYDDIEERLMDPPEPEVVFDDLPSEGGHDWRYIRFGPDGRLYIAVGAPCNVCERDDPFATILRMNPDGTGLETHARGIRNSVGFDWNPGTGTLWFTDNGRDWLGDDLPEDELNRAREAGLHFGFPYCHGGNISDPEFGEERSCDQFEPPVIGLGPHVAALGMRFYSGEMFPERYRGGIFVAEHGSWNRREPIGYRVVFVAVENDTALESEIFADGWLQEGEAWGRPVDVEVVPDGSLLVSDDSAGLIYRITYAA